MQRHLTSATKIANNTALSCEKFLCYVCTVDNNNTIIDTLFSHSDETVEISSTEEYTASGSPIGTVTARATTADQQQYECWTSWQT